MDSVHHIWCPLSSQEYQDLPDGAETTLTNVQIKAMNDCLSEELRGYESDGAFEGPKMHLLWWQVETPATDRIVAGIKADEEKAVLNDLLRHLDKIGIENLSSPWELSSEVVAFVNSRLLREGANK